MAEAATTASPPAEQAENEVQSHNQPKEPDTGEATAASEKKPVEVVANPDYITWKFPPYCELCTVHFCGEVNAQKHFEGANHTNKLATWRKYQNPESIPKTSKNVLCEICWKEVNTQAILDQHSKSPAHLKVAKERLVIQKLKEDYRQLRESQKTA